MSSFDGVPYTLKQYKEIEGLYLGPLNHDALLPSNIYKSYTHKYPDELEYKFYGVCDSPDQFMTSLGKVIQKLQQKFAVVFTIIRKIDQSSSGGWRWHKWGEYIGEKKPECEYLYDEDDSISEVYIYHIYEINEEKQDD